MNSQLTISALYNFRCVVQIGLLSLFIASMPYAVASYTTFATSTYEITQQPEDMIMDCSNRLQISILIDKAEQQNYKIPSSSLFLVIEHTSKWRVAVCTFF